MSGMNLNMCILRMFEDTFPLGAVHLKDIYNFHKIIITPFAAMGRRLIKMDEKFFLSYRKTAIKVDEILISVLFPFTSEVGL